MSEYTFTLNAIDRASPVVEEAIQRIRATLEAGSSQLSEALRILPSFNQAEFDRLLQTLNQVGNQAVERARVVGEQIGASLSAGVGPGNAEFEQLGARLNTVLREALVQARQQIQQFSETTNILPGGTAAGDVLQFAEQWQQTMLRSIQTVAGELRTQLNAAAREAGMDPRAISGQFQGSRITSTSSEALVGALGTPESTEAFRLRMEQLRTATSPAAAERVAQAVQTTDQVFEEAVNRVVQGLDLTQQHLAELRARGIAFDLHDPTSKSLTPITGPVGVRDIGQGGPSVYQLRPGEGTQYDPEQETVQLQRALERAIQVLDRETAAAEEATAADQERAVAARTLARLQGLEGSASVRRVGGGGAAPYAEFGAAGGSQFYETTGAAIEDQTRITQLQRQLFGTLESEATTEDRARTARIEAAEAAQRTAANQANLARLLQDSGAEFMGRSAIRSGGGDFFTRGGAPIVGDTPEGQLELQSLNAQYLNLMRRRNSQMESVTARQADNSASGLLNRFMGGAGGVGFDAHAQFDPQNAIGNLAGTAGVLLRYGATGIGITAGFRAIGELRTEIVGYQTALANLQEVLDSTSTKQVDLNAVITAAAPAGIGAAEAVGLATDALARYRQEVQDGADASTVMVTSLHNIAQAAVLTGQAAPEAAKQLIDATQGFGLGSTGQSRILDAVENARRNYGGDRAQVLQAVGQSGDLAQSAGVDPETLANMVALIQSRTGASGTAVASTIERTISRQGSTSFKQALGGLGIEDTGNIVSEIEQMSQAWDRLSKIQRDALISQLGGARQARELLPLLEEGSGLLDANKVSYAGAGAAASQYARDQNTLAGVIRQVGGGLKDLAQLLGSSGVFSVLGPLAIGFRDIVEAANAMLRIFNALPAPLRDVVLTLAEATLAVRVFGNAEQQAALGGALGRIPVIGAFARRIGLPGAGGQTQEVTAAQEAATAITGAGTSFAETVVAAAREAAAALTEGGAVAAGEMEAGGAGSAAGGVAGAARGFSTAELDVGAAGIGAGLADAVPGGMLAGGAALGAGAIGLLANPITWAIGGLIAIGGVAHHMQELDAAAAQGSDALTALAAATNAQDYQTAADALRSARNQLAQSSGGPFGTIAGWLSGNGAREHQFSQEAAFAQAEGKRVAAQSGNLSTLGAGVFGPTNDIVAGLQTMTQNGIDANTQLQAVAEALGLVATKSGDAASALAGGVANQVRAPGLLGGEATIVALARGATYTGAPPKVGDKGPGFTYGAQDIQVGEEDYQKTFLPRVRAFMQQNGIGANSVLSDTQLQSLASAAHPWQDFIALNPVDDHGRMVNKDTPVVEAARQKAIDQTVAYYRSLSDKAQQQQTGPVTNDALNTILNGPQGKGGGLLAQIQGARPDAFDPTGGAGAGGSLQNAVTILRSYVNRADPKGSNYPELIAAYHDAEDKLAAATISNLEKLRAAADARTNPKNLARVDQGFFDQEIAAAGSDTNQIIAIINNMTAAQLKLAQSVLENAVKTAQAAMAAARQLASHLGADERGGVLAGAQAGLDTANANLNAFLGAKQYYTGSGGKTDPNQLAIDQMQAQEVPGDAVQNAQIAVQVANYQLGNAKTADDKAKAEKAVKDADYQLRQARAGLAEAMAGASVYPGSAISAAAAQITQAKDAINAAAPGTAQWYQARRQLADAQIAYGNAVLADQANVRNLHGDTTDPVFKAREVLREAQAKLRFDRQHHATPDVLHGDEVAVKDDRAAAQAAQFTQRFQDAQTLHELGQMSDAAYMRYLTSEHDRLEGIKRRTRQQTDELYQVDQALKAAGDQMSGQWNIGNIKIPTPYEVRRFIATQAAGTGFDGGAMHAITAAGIAGSTVSNNNMQIVINGAGMTPTQVEAMFDRLIKQNFGTATLSRTGTTTPRVHR